MGPMNVGPLCLTPVRIHVYLTPYETRCQVQNEMTGTYILSFLFRTHVGHVRETPFRYARTLCNRASFSYLSKKKTRHISQQTFL